MKCYCCNTIKTISSVLLVITPLILLLLVVSNFYLALNDNVHIGVADISETIYSPEDSVVLSGQWEFYKNQLLTPESDFSKTNPVFIDVPGKWSSNNLPSYGFGTYRVKITGNHNLMFPHTFKFSEINSAYKIWIDNKLYALNGTIGSNPQLEKPSIVKNIFSCDIEKEEFYIIIQVSNFTLPEGGIIAAPIMGGHKAIQKSEIISNTIYIVLISCFILIFLIHIINYFMLSCEKYLLFFSLFSFFVAIRMILKYDNISPIFEKFLSPTIYIKMSYSIFYLAAVCLCVYIYTLFYREFSQTIIQFIKITSWFIFTIILFFPIEIYYTVRYFITIVSILFSIYIIHVLIKAILNKRDYAKIVLSGYFLLFSGFIIDTVIVNLTGKNYSNFSGIGVFSLLISQTLINAHRQNKVTLLSEKLSLNLGKINSSLDRFVPHEFLDYLKKKSITEVKLGDQVQKSMSILFADIRDFTKLSESISPQENFNFLNSYLKRVGPHIRDNGGFIDKFIGDEIMALFPKDCDSAVQAAVNIQKEVQIYNYHRSKLNYPPIEVGIGIHYGELMLGTVGDDKRMETTVISDAVNLTSRLQGLTKVFGSYILISDDIFFNLKNPNEYNIRFLGRVQVKGKMKSVAIYEIIDGFTQEVIDNKNKTKENFELGILNYFQKNFKKAISYFSKVIAEAPNDKAAHFYFSECNLCKISKLPSNWEGVIEMEKRKLW